MNAVLAVNAGEGGSETTVASRQHVDIVQRDGDTEVLEQYTDERPT